MTIQNNVANNQTPRQPMPGLAIGRMVHYLAAVEVSPALIVEERAAVINNVIDMYNGYVELSVFANTEDSALNQPIHQVRASYDHDYDENKGAFGHKLGTWHWIEKA